MSQVGSYFVFGLGLCLLYVVQEVEGQAHLLVEVEQASVEALLVALKEDDTGGDKDENKRLLSLEAKTCETGADCALEYCCSDLESCCLPTNRCGCMDPQTQMCGYGPIAVTANNGRLKNKFGTVDQIGAVACVQKGELKEKIVTVNLNLFHQHLMINGDVQQQVDEFIFHTKFYGRFNSEELVKTVLRRLRGKDIVAHLDDHQVEETVFEAFKRSAESIVRKYVQFFNGKQILNLLTNLQLEELFEESRKRREEEDVK